MKRSIRFLVACAATFAFCSLVVRADSVAPSTQPAMPTMDRDAMMKAMEQMGQPGPEHAELAKMVGEWTSRMECVMPGNAPMISEGEAKFELRLGGRFLHQKMTATMAGKQYNGLGVTGYDTQKKKYVSVWIDDGGTGIFTAEGEKNAEGAIVLTGMMPMPGVGDVKVKETMHQTDADHCTFSMAMVNADGSEVPMMNGVYTRKK
ncbi:MAG: DUF1579 domain-containing protein [Tepidisphaeraceae bacterium]